MIVLKKDSGITERKESNNLKIKAINNEVV
jgi:hypothetical protein